MFAYKPFESAPIPSTEGGVLGNHDLSWLSVQNSPLGPTVTRQMGVPTPGPEEVLVQILCCSLCRADSRLVMGLKASRGTNSLVQLGHEGVGIVVDANEEHQHLLSELVVFLPHIREKGHDCDDCRSGKHYRCKHSLHGGFDVDGPFGNFLLAPARNVKVIPQETIYLAQQAALATDRPWPAILSMIEPWSCILTGYQLIMQVDRQQMSKRLATALQARTGRALLIGCGVMSGMWAILLSASGWNVHIYDIDNTRTELLYKQLDRRVRIFVPGQDSASFDLLVVNTSAASASREAFSYAGDRSLIHFFSGINNAEKEKVTSPGGALNIEELHRNGDVAAQAVSGEKWVYLAGHSGYTNAAFDQAIQNISSHAIELAPMITGLVNGLASDTVKSLLPGVDDYRAPGAPVLPAVLNGEWGRMRQKHLKVAIATVLLPKKEMRKWSSEILPSHS